MEASNVERTVVGAAFRERAQAEAALEELHRIGIEAEDISVTVREDSDEVDREWLRSIEDQAADDAATSVAAGGLLGGLLGAGVAVAVPGVGTALGVGIIAASIAGGAFAGGIAGPLATIGMTDEAADFLDQEFRRGSIIIVVHPEDRTHEIQDILRKHGGLDATTA